MPPLPVPAHIHTILGSCLVVTMLYTTHLAKQQRELKWDLDKVKARLAALEETTKKLERNQKARW